MTAKVPEKPRRERQLIYGTARWRKLRHWVLQHEPLCLDCKSRERLEPATEVDHVIPIEQGGSPFEVSNLMPLCASCHSSKTAREDMPHRRKVPWSGACDINGMPTDPRHPWRRDIDRGGVELPPEASDPRKRQ
jgi:5-methylcytosine-specific restriction protein A